MWKASQASALAVGFLLLVGCSNGSGSTLTVNGTVVETSGQPAVGKTVVLSNGNFRKTLVTDGDGGFSLTKVPPPYTAMVVDAAGATAIVYQGLSRTDPTLTDTVGVAPNRSATFAGQVSGGGTGFIALNLLFASPDVVQNVAPSGSGDGYEAQVSWYGPATTTGTLYAIETQFGAETGGPVGYPGYGTRSNIELQDMGALAGQDVALSPVPSGTLSGTVSLPSGFSMHQETLWLLVAPGLRLNLYDGFLNSSPAFSYTTPAVPGTSVVVGTAAFGTAGDSVSAQATASANDAGVMLNLIAPPTLLSPPDGATGVTVTTGFSWTAFPSGISLLQISGGGTNITVVTTGTAATLFNVASGGVTIPNGSYSWNVIGLAPVASVDAVAAPGGLTQLLEGDLTQGQSVQQTFTVTP